MRNPKTGSPGGTRLQGLVPPPEDEGLREITDALVAAGGESVMALILYGSRIQRSTPDRWSAYDFFLVTDSYAAFFGRLSVEGHLRKPAWLFVLLSHFLPPNILSFGGDEAGVPLAKSAVITPRHFRRALGPRSRDHFMKGRMVQRLSLVWSRSPAEEDFVIAALREAREGIVRWVRPYLPGSFDLETFAGTMLRVSYRGEIRPESPERVSEVFESQKDTLLAIAQESLDAAVLRGTVLKEGETFRWARNPGRLSRMGMSAYFGLSKARATARWFKYMVTFEGWLDYILRKIQRRLGRELEVTERERRWPIIFLWPKLFQVLRAVKEAERETPAEGNEEDDG